MIPTASDLYTAFDSEPGHIVSFLQGLIGSYRLPQPLRVLDVGCGPGRLLRPLEQLGWEVTGMEPNPDFLAGARGIASGSRRLRVLPGGFQEIEGDAVFDLVTGINSAFAHLLQVAERADAIRRVHRVLRPGGVLFVDLPNFLWILRNYRPPRPHDSVVMGREVTLHRRHEIDYHNATFTTLDRYEFADGASHPVQVVHAYGISTLPEILSHLHDAGFTGIRTYRGYDSTEAARIDGPRVLVAAQTA